MGKTKKHKKFFQGDSPHGVVKRVMYKKYLQAYIAMTQSERFNLRTRIIDGFAGAGRYSNEWPEEIEKYGSPLIAVMVVLGHVWKRQRDKEKKMKKTVENREEDTDPAPVFGWESLGQSPREELDRMKKNQRVDLHDGMDTKVSMIFIEKDKGNYTTLLCNIELLVLKFLQRHYPAITYNFKEGECDARFSITTEPFSVSIEVYNRPFEEYEPRDDDLLANDVRSLTFVDPFGYTHTPMDHLEKFAPGEGNEIMINFMSRDVNRFAEEQPDKISKLYGLPNFNEVASDYWIDPPNKAKLGKFIKYIIHSVLPDPAVDKRPMRVSIQQCVDSYELFLKRKTDSSFSLVFEVRGQGNCIIYHMVYITNHIRGVEAMKSAMSKCSQQEGDMVMSDYHIIRNGEQLIFQKSQNDQVVAAKIFEKFKGQENIIVQLSAAVTNMRGKIDRRTGKCLYEKSPSVNEFVLLQTNYCLWKRPLAILQREGKITKVLQNGKPQKRKNTFPEIDKKTKEPIETRIWFALDEPESGESEWCKRSQVDSTLDYKDEKARKKLKRGRKPEETTDAKEGIDKKRHKKGNKQTDELSNAQGTSGTQ